MPLYEYCCAKCDASEERLDSYSSPTQHDCPVCGSSGGMRRKISVPSISFSGGGWYAQGYGEAPPCKAGEGTGKGGAEGQGKQGQGKQGQKEGQKEGAAKQGNGAGAACCGGCPMADVQ